MYSRNSFLGASSSMPSATSSMSAAASMSGASTFGGSVVSDAAIPTTGGTDPSTDALIAQLLYDDLQELLDARKGKARAGGPLSDAEYALQLQSEQLEQMLTEMRDVQIATGLSRALGADRDIINALALDERVAQQDRAAAQALSQGRALPPLTKEQRAIERGVVRDDALMSDDTDDILATLSPNFKSTPPTTPTPSIFGKGKGKATAFQSSSTASPPSFPITLFGSFSVPPVKRPQCVSCDDTIPPGKLFVKVPCDHHYCADCLVSLVRAATSDESLFPVRCCRKNIPTENLTKFLPSSLLNLFQDKSREFGTPAQQRVYCCIPTCSTFLGNAQDVLDDWGAFSLNLYCNKCSVGTCVECRQRAHPNNKCRGNNSNQQIHDFARAQGWQTCPSCSRVIELSFGCNHMTCHCGYQFCYECAAKWKTCRCKQWEEHRLYATAEARMERELGQQMRAQRPDVFEREVREFAQNLRVNHDCYPNHRWRGHGPGACEECGMYMRVYLRMCKDCRLTVCRRCSNNRL